MNWKTEAVEKLREYSVMCHAAQNLPRQIRLLEEEATAVKSVGFSGTKIRSESKREEFLLNNLMKRQELEKLLEHNQGWLDAVDDALSALEPDEQKILQGLYILPVKGASADLCQELGMEHATLYRKRDKALRRFTLALYGALER